jgi:ATP-dependent Lon protease
MRNKRGRNLEENSDEKIIIKKKKKCDFEKEIDTLSEKDKEKLGSLHLKGKSKSYTLEEILNSDLNNENMTVAITLYEQKLKLIEKLKSNKDPDYSEEEEVEGIPTTPEGYDQLISSLMKVTAHAAKCKKMREQVSLLQTTEDVKEILLAKIDEYAGMEDESGSLSTESANTLASYLHFALSLPYGKQKSFWGDAVSGRFDMSRDAILKRVKEHLDAKLFGMQKVKEQLLVALNNKLSNPSAKFSLGFKGPPGVGKTQVASVFAEALGFPIEKLSLGGLHDSSILKGSAKNWVGSSPSEILRMLARMKVSNGIILFDEIDKLNTEKGIDVQNALIHITDYSSNSKFEDSFINDFTHDISNVIFFYSMNDETNVNPILLDRLTVIEIDAYTRDELANIGLRYTLPKEMKALNLSDEYEKFTIDHMKFIVDKIYGNSSSGNGVRKLEKAIKYICSCLNFMKHSTMKLNFVPTSTTSDKITLSTIEFLLKSGELIKKNRDEPPFGLYT